MWSHQKFVLFSDVLLNVKKKKNSKKATFVQMVWFSITWTGDFERSNSAVKSRSWRYLSSCISFSARVTSFSVANDHRCSLRGSSCRLLHISRRARYKTEMCFQLIFAVEVHDEFLLDFCPWHAKISLHHDSLCLNTVTTAIFVMTLYNSNVIICRFLIRVNSAFTKQRVIPTVG